MTSMNHNEVVNDFQAMLDQAEPPMTSDCCIYRVPFDIRKLKEDAYTPTVVSIGPLHHQRHPHLQNMERHKLIYCKSFLQRAEASLDTLIHYIEEVEPKFRSCYCDTIDLSKETLVKMILIDSGFIIELFWRRHYLERSEDETIFIHSKIDNDILYDMCLLENQVPFFVLDYLFNLSFGSGSNLSFLGFTFDYFSFFNINNLAYDNVSIRHFTDLIRMFHLQHPRPPSIYTESMVHLVHLPSATQLLEGGVTFKVNTEGHLRFSGRILEIPRLTVTDRTEILYRNLLALEQCLYPEESYIINYIVILDFLINTNRDVDILVRKKILVNWLGNSDSVANLFNSLTTNIMVSNFPSHYFQICEDLNAFCTDPLHKLKATLRHDYCKTPWQTVASIAGIVLLFLSLIQSVCSVLLVQQCKAPRSS